jgi:long-chain acyl-CoA synthetase
VLLTGGSGFLGKVWLVMMLDLVPDIGRIYVLLRKKALQTARERFEKIVATSPAFAPLHDRFGRELGRHIVERIEFVDGDLSKPDLGLEPALAERLRRDTDLVIHCAGLVDFDPDLRDAITTNVNGTQYIADFVEQSDHAALLHISTCYVTGTRTGEITEELLPNFAPDGEAFDIDDERRAAAASIERVLAEYEGEDKTRALREKALRQIHARGLNPENTILVRNITRRLRRQAIKSAMVEEGQRRAYDRGWPNIYTYTKSMAESLLIKRRDKLTRMSILRPAIVESALCSPFPGWNQGFNTSGPLSYVLGTWFRHLPARNDNPFDIIPVDYVARAIAIVGAALMEDVAAPVYQCGTSDINRMTIDRACELTALAHRRHLREHGATPLERVLLSRWDAVPTDPDHLLSTDNISSVAEGFSSVLRGIPKRWPKALRRGAERWAKKADDARDKLSTIDRVLTLYLPFIYENFFVFQSAALRELSVVEPEFQVDTASIDWREYWIDIHMPGLRKWCYPLIEGKTPEKYSPEHPFKLPAEDPAAALHRRKETGS